MKPLKEMRDIIDSNKVLGISIYPTLYRILKDYGYFHDASRFRKTIPGLYPLYKYYVLFYLILSKFFPRRKIKKSRILALLNNYEGLRLINEKLMDPYIEPLLMKYKIPAQYAIDDKRHLKYFLQSSRYPAFIDFLKIRDYFTIYRDFNRLRGIIRKIGEPYLSDWVLFNIIVNIYTADAMIRKVQPDLIMMSCEHFLISEALIGQGKRHGINTLAIQHGGIYEHTEHYRDIDEEYLVPDYYIMYSEYEKNILKDRMKSKILVLGKYQYDEYIDLNVDKEKVCKKFGIDSEKKIVLFHSMSDTWRGNQEKSIDLLFNFFKKYEKNFHLVIKLHPCCKGKLFWKYKDISGSNAIIIPGDQDNHSLTAICNYEISIFSSVTTDAILLGKFVAILDADYWDKESNYYVNENVGPLLKTWHDFENIFNKSDLNQLIEKYAENRAIFIKKRFAHIGESEKKHIDLIKKLLAD